MVSATSPLQAIPVAPAPAPSADPIAPDVSPSKPREGRWKAFLWPSVDTPAAAEAATKSAAWAAIFCAAVTLLMVILTASGVSLGWTMSRSPSAIVDAAIFAGIAGGLLRKSRIAAVLGLVWYIIGWLSVFSEHHHGSTNSIVRLFLTIAFVHGVRGAFSWQRRRPPGQPPRPDAARVAPGPRRSYVVRHWRGELSLPVSYWINFIGLGWVFAIVERVLNASAAELLVDNTALAAAGMLAFWLMLYSSSTWQIVGVWRSASRRIVLTGKRGWARTAHAMCLLSVVMHSAMLFATAVPQVLLFGPLAVGVDSMGSPVIKVIGKGREIEVSGPISFGTSERVRGRLNLYPNARVIRLNSDGGYVSGMSRRLLN